MKALWPAFALLMALGCAKPATAPETQTADTAAKVQTKGGGGSDSIQPMVPGAGPVTPVAGSDSVQGAGSATGTGDVAKQRARGLQDKLNGAGQPQEGE